MNAAETDDRTMEGWEDAGHLPLDKLHSERIDAQYRADIDKITGWNFPCQSQIPQY